MTQIGHALLFINGKVRVKQ